MRIVLECDERYLRPEGGRVVQNGSMASPSCCALDPRCAASVGSIEVVWMQSFTAVLLLVLVCQPQRRENIEACMSTCGLGGMEVWRPRDMDGCMPTCIRVGMEV